MKKIISLIILISFLFTNTVFSSTTLRAPMKIDKERVSAAFETIQKEGDNILSFDEILAREKSKYSDYSYEQPPDDQYEFNAQSLISSELLVQARRIYEIYGDFELRLVPETYLNELYHHSPPTYFNRLDKPAYFVVESPSSVEPFLEIGGWIYGESPQGTFKIKELIKELKSGTVVFSYTYNHQAIQEKGTISLRRGFKLVHNKGAGYGWDGHGSQVWPIDSMNLSVIPEDILKVASENLGINVKPISKDGIKHLKHETNDLIFWKPLVRIKKLKTITEENIGRYLRSLASNSPIKNQVKRVIVKKLQKLQQKRPETIPIIREKALALLEINEDKFRGGLEPFIGGYIAIRDAIRQAGISDDTAEFYRLFDTVVKGISVEKPEDYRVVKYINQEYLHTPEWESAPSEIVWGDESKMPFYDAVYSPPKKVWLMNKYFAKRAVFFVKEYGGVRIRYSYQPSRDRTVTKVDGRYVYDYATPQSHSFREPEKYIISVFALTDISTLKTTPVLFSDTEVASNPNGFKNVLSKLRANEANIPVILLTKETKDTLEAKLKGFDLKGVQFKTPAELGLQDLKWDKDERVSDIADIENLRCIPLTQPLCESFKDLRRARDQV